jgi:DNA-binding CsgD family transcriptional regulator
MGHSQRLRLRDLRDAYRLIGECQDLGADPVEWRRTMLGGLCRLIDAPLAMGGEALWVGPGRRFAFVWGPMHVGPYDPKGMRWWSEYAREHLPEGNPVINPLSRVRAPLVTRAREQLLEDRVWYRCPDCAAIREALGFDHTVLSEYGVAGPDEVNVISFARPPGGRPFSGRERRLLHVFHHELGPLVGNRLARGRHGGPKPLSPRLRQTLERLLDGDGEKQMARRLGLSPSTVHQYVTELYRRYGVSSRAELMARWVRRSGGGAAD